jgi:hypothetical protein
MSAMLSPKSTALKKSHKAVSELYVSPTAWGLCFQRFEFAASLLPAASRLSLVFACVPLAALCSLTRERIAESQALTIEQLIRDKSAVLAEKAAMESAANGTICSFFLSLRRRLIYCCLDMILCPLARCNVFDSLLRSLFSRAAVFSDFSATRACQSIISSFG